MRKPLRFLMPLCSEMGFRLVLTPRRHRRHKGFFHIKPIKTVTPVAESLMPAYERTGISADPMFSYMKPSCRARLQRKSEMKRALVSLVSGSGGSLDPEGPALCQRLGSSRKRQDPSSGAALGQATSTDNAERGDCDVQAVPSFGICWPGRPGHDSGAGRCMAHAVHGFRGGPEHSHTSEEGFGASASHDYF